MYKILTECKQTITLKRIINVDQLISLVGRAFANAPGDLCSIPGHVIPKTLKIVLGTYLFNTQQCKLRIKGKVEKSRKKE